MTDARARKLRELAEECAIELQDETKPDFYGVVILRYFQELLREAAPAQGSAELDDAERTALIEVCKFYFDEDKWNPVMADLRSAYSKLTTPLCKCGHDEPLAAILLWQGGPVCPE